MLTSLIVPIPLASSNHDVVSWLEFRSRCCWSLLRVGLKIFSAVEDRSVVEAFEPLRRLDLAPPLKPGTKQKLWLVETLPAEYSAEKLLTLDRLELEPNEDDWFDRFDEWLLCPRETGLDRCRPRDTDLDRCRRILSVVPERSTVPPNLRN